MADPKKDLEVTKLEVKLEEPKAQPEPEARPTFKPFEPFKPKPKDVVRAEPKAKPKKAKPKKAKPPKHQVKNVEKEHKVSDLRVASEDGHVILAIGHHYVQLTGGEAQKFSREVAEAAMETGV